MIHKISETQLFEKLVTFYKTEAEVKRLDQLKASKMKELFQKKQEELELICKKSHVEIPSREEMNNIINLINSGESKKLSNVCIPFQKLYMLIYAKTSDLKFTYIYHRGDWSFGSPLEHGWTDI